MEQELIDNLKRVAAAFTTVRALGPKTLGRLAAGDWRFFEHLDDSSKTFTARKYDQVMGWFSANWPARAKWPADVLRPEPLAAEPATVEAGQ